jgi:carboxypeptidase family protein
VKLDIAVAVFITLAFGGAARAWPQGLQISNGVLVGRVTRQGAAIPLPGGPVSIDGLIGTRVADEAGRFRFDSLPTGIPLRVRVRHIGYQPAVVSITLVAGVRDSIQVELSPVAVTLTSVAVWARRECTAPGRPSALMDSALSAIFDRLDAYGAKVREVSAAYPLEYFLDEKSSRRLRAGVDLVTPSTVGSYQSPERWRYRPGHLSPPWLRPDSNFKHVSVMVSRTDVGGHPVFLHPFNVPLVRQLTDSLFLASHCFSNGGRATVDSGRYQRVDFVAAKRIDTPDVDGSLYLDTATSQIRRTEMRLTTFPFDVRDVISMEFTTDFVEVAPWLPLPQVISATERFRSPSDKDAPVVIFEMKELIDVVFRNGRPAVGRSTSHTSPQHGTPCALGSLSQ